MNLGRGTKLKKSGEEKKVNRRIIAILLAFTLLAVTASCGRNLKDGYSNEEAISNIDFDEDPVTITYLTIGDKPTNGRTEEIIEELNKILLKNLNARLDIYYVGWTDYLRNYNNVVSNKNIGLDIVGASTDWLDAWPNVIDGNFMPLTDEMLRKYCGLTYTNVSESQWDACSYNDTIYLIPENEYTQWTNHGFIYRTDLAKEAGLESVSSWEDLTTYFEGVTAYHPEIIPWDIASSNRAPLGYIMSKMDYSPIYELTTYGIWGEDEDNTGKITSPYYVGDTFVEYAKLMKYWNEIGVFRKDLSAVGDNEEEFYDGETAVIQHHTQNFYTGVKPRMMVKMPEVDVDFFWFGKENGNLMRASVLHGAVAISAYSKNPERALMVYDMLRNDEECYRLIRYGLEGKQYQVNDSGMVEKPNGFNSDKDGAVLNYWWGRRDEFEIPDASYAWDDYYDLVDSYEHVAYPYPWDGVPFSTPGINIELNRIVAIFDRYIPEISTGSYEGSAEDKVAMFREELMKAGFERVTGQLQRIYNSQ